MYPLHDAEGVLLEGQMKRIPESRARSRTNSRGMATPSAASSRGRPPSRRSPALGGPAPVQPLGLRKRIIGHCGLTGPKQWSCRRPRRRRAPASSPAPLLRERHTNPTRQRGGRLTPRWRVGLVCQAMGRREILKNSSPETDKDEDPVLHRGGTQSARQFVRPVAIPRQEKGSRGHGPPRMAAHTRLARRLPVSAVPSAVSPS
jgi:hypothetical protein